MSEARAGGDVLRLEAVTRSYRKGHVGEIRVLAGVDLAIRRGEVVGLVAPSGTGKSTLLHIAGLLDSPDEGQVVINGTDFASAPDGLRTRVRRPRGRFRLPVPPSPAGVLCTRKRRPATACRGNGAETSRFLGDGTAGANGPRKTCSAPAVRAVGRRAATGRVLSRAGQPARSAARRRTHGKPGFGVVRDRVRGDDGPRARETAVCPDRHP